MNISDSRLVAALTCQPTTAGGDIHDAPTRSKSPLLALLYFLGALLALAASSSSLHSRAKKGRRDPSLDFSALGVRCGDDFAAGASEIHGEFSYKSTESLRGVTPSKISLKELARESRLEKREDCEHMLPDRPLPFASSPLPEFARVIVFVPSITFGQIFMAATCVTRDSVD